MSYISNSTSTLHGGQLLSLLEAPSPACICEVAPFIVRLCHPWNIQPALEGFLARRHPAAGWWPPLATRGPHLRGKQWRSAGREGEGGSNGVTRLGVTVWWCGGPSPPWSLRCASSVGNDGKVDCCAGCGRGVRPVHNRMSRKQLCARAVPETHTSRLGQQGIC